MFLSAASLILFCLIIFVLLSILKIEKNVKTAVFLSAIVGNTIYMGFPVIELGLGKEYLSSGALIASVYLIIALLISIFAIRYWQGQDRRIAEQLKEFFKNPLVISVFIGIILSFLKLEYPLILSFKKSIAMLGLTASPVALFAMGGFLYGRFLRENLNFVILASFLKLIAFPIIIFLGSYYLFNLYALNAVDLKILILLSSMPVAVTTFVITERFNLDKALVGNSILISTILSFFVAPLLIFLLQ
jgi:predicted permease